MTSYFVKGLELSTKPLKHCILYLIKIKALSISYNSNKNTKNILFTKQHYKVFLNTMYNLKDFHENQNRH